jgi:very-short-patch-repair endonuclease
VTDAGRGFAHWWAGIEPGRVVKLATTPAGQVEPGMCISPDAGVDAVDCPAVVWCRVGDDADRGRTDGVANLLAQVEQTVLALFPRWLPDAALFEGFGGGTIAAVRSVAARTAAASEHYGPYLADLSERALRARRDLPRIEAVRTFDLRNPVSGEPDFPVPLPVHPAPVRAAELARVISDAYGRRSAVMLIKMPVDLSEHAERALIDAAAWIAHHGAWRIGLVPADAPEQGRAECEQVRRIVPGPVPGSPQLPSDVDTANVAAAEVAMEGTPRFDSPAERALEAALRSCPWAVGRVWNQTYQSGLLAPIFRLDLWWPAERCVVEIDGPEHRAARHYAADRRRDVQLQLDGQIVLRFTNDDVLSDVSTVVARIERFVRGRRR